MNRFTTAILAAQLLPLLGTAEMAIDYSRDVLPILSENCFECHGPDENTREAGRRLDTAEGAYQNLDGIVAIAPGKPDSSEVVYLMNTEFAEERMPPVDSNKELSEAEKSIIYNWIQQGAEYDTHWAFEKPVKRSPPKTGNPIDAFIQERLENEGLEPSERADPYTLLRRLNLDLIGLPPSPSEIEAFVASFEKDPDGAIKLKIDELMSLPAFGEKWARHWLDVARYADTNGFEKDKPRDQWIYREWVIEALNDDMPYDQFLIEQLAGDLLPNASQDQIVASGFMRNGMVNEEGAIIPEQFRIEGIFDRMDCFGKATLGLTLQCAQCHTHKYDPISHDEYFGLFSFFNDTYEAKSWVYSDEQLNNIERIDSKVAELEQEIRDLNPDWESDFVAWQKSQLEKQTEWTIWDTDIQDWEGGLNHPKELSDLSILVLGHPTVTGTALIEGKSPLPMITGMRLEALTHADQPFRGPGRSYWGTFAVSEWEVYRKWPGEEDWVQVELERATADFATEVRKLDEYFYHKAKDPDNERRTGPARFLIDGKEKTAWSPDRGPILRHAESSAAVQFKEPLAMPEGSELRVRLLQNHGGDRNGRDNQQLGNFRFALSSDPKPTVPNFDHAAYLALQKPKSQRTQADRETLFRAWRKSDERYGEINEAIAALEAEYPEAKTSVLHSLDTDSQFSRITRLLDKGTWDKPKHEVKRSTPAILNPMEVQNPNRLDLAHWVTDDEAPLTARVQVNRVWQAIFGEGLVETPEDFGTRAPRPEHLELFDWLAVDFMENGWSQKELIRRILSSDTYQQSSQVEPMHLQKDPKNRLYARGPRFRVEAEVVRDLALSASGLLNGEIGGPSIFPPVPKSVLDNNYLKPVYWKEAEGDDRYRRSLYTFRKRSMPDPVLSSFDAPNADFSCVRRIRTNTPLSALTSLNEPIFVESAQSLALRILTEGGDSTESRTRYGYLLTTGRPANQNEIKEIAHLIDSQSQRLAEGWLNTQEIAFIDPDNPPELPDGITPRDVASWAIASRVLINLDETLNKN